MLSTTHRNQCGRAAARANCWQGSCVWTVQPIWLDHFQTGHILSPSEDFQTSNLMLVLFLLWLLCFPSLVSLQMFWDWCLCQCVQAWGRHSSGYQVCLEVQGRGRMHWPEFGWYFPWCRSWNVVTSTLTFFLNFLFSWAKQIKMFCSEVFWFHTHPISNMGGTQELILLHSVSKATLPTQKHRQYAQLQILRHWCKDSLTNQSTRIYYYLLAISQATELYRLAVFFFFF